MFWVPPPGRAIGETISFPIDSTSRAFRRARSESNFPLEKLERSSTKLKFVPIQLQWRSAGNAKELDSNFGGCQREGVAAMRATKPLAVDPHRTGFGRNPVTTRYRSPPPCPIRAGVLGVDPGGRTRGNIAVEEGVDMGGAGI